MSYLSRSVSAAPRSRCRLPARSPNSAGGYAWAVDDWARLRRFLVLGTRGRQLLRVRGKLTRENADAVAALPRSATARARSPTIVAVSRGRPRAEERPGHLRARDGGRRSATRRPAGPRSPRCRDVCRTGTHLFQFATFVEEFRGWGRGLRRAVGGWYARARRSSARLPGGQVPQRDGGSHRDLLRLAHPAGRVSAGNPTLEVTREHAACSSGSSAAARPRRPAAPDRGLRAARAGDATRLRRRLRSSASTACRARRCRASTSPRRRCGRRCSRACR